MKIRYIIVFLGCFMQFSAMSFAASGAESEEASVKQEYIYMHMQPLVANLYKGVRREGVVTVHVTLVIEDEEVQSEVERQRMRVQDALLRKFSDLSRLYLRVDQPVDIEFLTQYFQYETDRVLSEKGGVEVLISDVSMQRR
tara:strand:- start:855 stop:1277 length:423 start_codon:yes stop_codon:yes gene_type:complete